MWFRRDRGWTTTPLYHALKSCRQVFCLFVLDKGILDPFQG
jgi:deoxyribodipyrimidine photo-lyase